MGIMAHSSQAPLSAVALAGLVMLLFGGSVAAAEGAGALRGTTSGSEAVAEAADVAAVVDNSNSSVLPPLDDLEAFVERDTRAAAATPMSPRKVAPVEAL